MAPAPAASTAGDHEQAPARIRTTEDLEVPRPLRLFLTAGFSLGESAVLPVAAYLAAAWLGGRDAGLIAGLAAIWLTAAIRKVVTGSVPNPLVAQLAAEVVALRQPANRHPGLHRFFQGATWLWAGIFLTVLRRLGLRLRFAQA
jgi:hypothetical protein